MELSTGARVVKLDSDGYIYEIKSADYRVWINYRLLPSVGVYCRDCLKELVAITKAKEYCKACNLELNPQDTSMSEKGERFRLGLEAWLHSNTAMNLLEASLLTYELQDFIIKTSWEAHAHYANEMGWRK